MDPVSAFIVILVILLLILAVLYVAYANVNMIPGIIQYAPNPKYCVTKGVNGGIQISTCDGSPEQNWVYDKKNGEMTYAGDATMCISGPPDGSEGVTKLVPCTGSPPQTWAYNSNAKVFQSGSSCLNLDHSVQQNGTNVLYYPCSGVPNPNETWIFQQ